MKKNKKNLAVVDKKSNKSSKSSKWGKGGLKTAKIPRSILEKVLSEVHDDREVIWKRPSCDTSIHSTFCEKMERGPETMKAKYARLCLLHSNWRDLGQVLSINSLTKVTRDFYAPLFQKYAVICLAHTNPELFQSYLHAFSIKGTPNEVLRKATLLQHLRENDDKALY